MRLSIHCPRDLGTAHLGADALAKESPGPWQRNIIELNVISIDLGAVRNT
jgi:hypothetical protein